MPQPRGQALLHPWPGTRQDTRPLASFMQDQGTESVSSQSIASSSGLFQWIIASFLVCLFSSWTSLFDRLSALKHVTNQTVLSIFIRTI